jgi:3-keto-disaccharide hydrolase
VLAAAAVAVSVLVRAAGARLTPHAGTTSSRVIGFGGAPVGEPWPDDKTYGEWYSLHNGFGLTQVELSGGVRFLTMATRAATTDGETYSSLVRTTRSFGDVDFTLNLLTTGQLRSPAPNPWEVAWVLWRYTDNHHFYSFIVKPNGWELAKEDPAYPGSQRFLASSSVSSFPIGHTYHVRVRQVADTITVWVDGLRLARFTDRERPYRSGSIALYAEDSAVRYSQLELRPVRR